MGQVVKIEQPISLLSLTTFTLWVGCLLVGVLGLWIGYPGKAPQARAVAVTQAQMIQVELTDDPLPRPSASAANPATPTPPSLSPLPALPEAPALVPVAQPALVAFSLPVEGPVVTVSTNEAVASAPPASVNTRPAAVPKQITFGQGEGKQPAPEYPYQAARSGQEGSVGVRFHVGPTGRVASAEVVTPSPWPLLNQAALKTIRDRWRFQPGAERYFEVSIRFQLEK